jgi:hypothetical protein
MTTHNILIIVLLCACTTAFGQYADHYERSALASYYSKDYKTAMLFSEKVLELDSRNITSLFVAGESARMIQDFEKAEYYLEQIPDNAKAGYFGITDFRLASVKEILGKKQEAERYYRKYLEERDSDTDLLALLAREALEMLDKGIMVDRRKADYISISRLPENINSELLEVAPLRYADKIYFTSVYKENDKAKPVRRIYESLLDGQPRLVEVNPQNEKLSATFLSLMPDASRMYYSICHDQDYHQTNECQLWFRERNYEGDWGPPKKLPSYINLKGFTATQPSVGWDKTLNKYVLFFASNRPGGMGKMDIWYSAIERDGTFGEPVLLPINSREDDVSPFFHQASQTLFFSSKGWPGYGNFDIFRTNRKPGNDWITPENLGELLNSYHDELNYTYHSNTHSAYFVSNRPASRCGDKQNNQYCLDIYEARVFVELDLKTFNSRSKMAVLAPQLELEEMSSDATFGSFASPDDKNEISIKLETGKIYRLKVIVNGYDPKYVEINTQDISYFTTLEKNVYLDGLIDP